MTNMLQTYAAQLEELAQESGLDYYPVDFELVPDSFMMEVAVYGLPVRMPHWSFGVRYIYQLVQHRMGHSRLFEVVFPGNPGRAYLARNNSLEENTLVTAHVLGHADFAKNNILFKNSQEQVGYRIVEQAAAHAHRIAAAIKEHGEARVERILDAALSLEQYIDIHKGLARSRYPEYIAEQIETVAGEFKTRFDALTTDTLEDLPDKEKRRAPIPPYPERDLLWFIANYAPELEGWERDIFHAVREESFYFHPVFACQIMNEGWASFWHARLLRDAEFLPQQLYLDAIKAHSDVVRPYAGEQQVSLSINPYHLGFSMWERIVEDQGLDKARTIMQQDDDFSFIRNYLTEDMAADLGLFTYVASRQGAFKVKESPIETLRETILSPKFNFGAPSIDAINIQTNGTLELEHQHKIDGRGLDLSHAEKVLEYIHRVWHRPVIIHTVNERGEERTVVKGG